VSSLKLLTRKAYPAIEAGTLTSFRNPQELASTPGELLTRLKEPNDIIARMKDNFRDLRIEFHAHCGCWVRIWLSDGLLISRYLSECGQRLRAIADEVERRAATNRYRERSEAAREGWKRKKIREGKILIGTNDVPF